MHNAPLIARHLGRCGHGTPLRCRIASDLERWRTLADGAAVDDESYNNWIAARDRFEQSPELAIHTRLRRFERSATILRSNLNDFQKDLELWERLGTVRAGGIESGGRERRDELMVDSLRLLHNFAASVVSYRDHAGAFHKRHYKKAGLVKDFPERHRKVFFQTKTMNFLALLRNQILHVETQPISITTNLTMIDRTRADVKGTVFLSVKHLHAQKLRNDEYGPAKEFLIEVGSKVDLGRLVPVVADQFEKFHSWMVGELGRVHHHDLQRLQEMNKEILRLQERMGP